MKIYQRHNRTSDSVDLLKWERDRESHKRLFEMLQNESGRRRGNKRKKKGDREIYWTKKPSEREVESGGEGEGEAEREKGIGGYGKEEGEREVKEVQETMNFSLFEIPTMLGTSTMPNPVLITPG